MMRFYTLPCFLLLFNLTLLSCQAQTPTPTPELGPDAGEFAQAFTPTLMKAKAYTLEVAAAMPEDKYAYRPTPEVRSFAEALLHITALNFNFVAQYIKKEYPPVSLDYREPVNGRTKAEIMALLDQSYDWALSALANFSDTQAAEMESVGPQPPRRRDYIMTDIRDHVTHHRGQLIVYLRINGIEPPFYR